MRTALVCLALAPWLNSRATAQPPALRPKPTDAEVKAIRSCLDIIRGCQLPDGAFNMVNDGTAAGAPVWVAPYFVNHSMLALLAANDFQKNPADLARVGKWLEWCAKHQDAGGFWHDQTGTVAAYKSNGMVDAHDSSAALYLVVVERYQRAGGKVSGPVRAAALASFRCIQAVTDADGLTWAKPAYKVKFLMDNIEVHAGLVAAHKLFTATQDAAEAKAAGTQAAKIGRALKLYWEAKEKKRFAWALHPSGAYDGGLDQIYPHGLAQLFGVSFVTADAAAFEAVTKAFKPQTTREGVGAERFLIAAARLGGPDEKVWRGNVVRAAGGFTPKSVYVFRPGLVILGLLEGADWMPPLADGK